MMICPLSLRLGRVRFPLIVQPRAVTTSLNTHSYPPTKRETKRNKEKRMNEMGLISKFKSASKKGEWVKGKENSYESSQVIVVIKRVSRIVHIMHCKPQILLHFKVVINREPFHPSWVQTISNHRGNHTRWVETQATCATNRERGAYWMISVLPNSLYCTLPRSALPTKSVQIGSDLDIVSMFSRFLCVVPNTRQTERRE
jgi:hypothetical protein